MSADCDSDGLLDAACVAADGTRRTRRSSDLCVQRANASAAECPAVFGSAKQSLDEPALSPASDAAAAGETRSTAGEADTAAPHHQPDQSSAADSASTATEGGAAASAPGGGGDKASGGRSVSGGSTGIIVGCAVAGLVAAAAAVVGVRAWRKAGARAARVAPEATASVQQLQQT